MVRYLKKIYVLFILVFSSAVFSSQFEVGETVFVAYPAANIKEDAFIVGKVTAVADDGDYLLSVIEFVEGHEYGLSCVPMVKKSSANQASEYSVGWELWKDTTTLSTEALDYKVSAKNVLTLDVGKHLFIERNNLFIVFGRWKSDAPMLTVDRIDRAQQEAILNNVKGLPLAFDLVRLHRLGFYGQYGRPYQPYETIEPLNRALDMVVELLNQDTVLRDFWFSKARDWEAISKSADHYFLIEAIDKVVQDANAQLYETGLEQADAGQLGAMKQKLKALRRR